MEMNAGNEAAGAIKLPADLPELLADLSLSARACAPAGPCLVFFRREARPQSWGCVDAGSGLPEGPLPLDLELAPGNALELALFEGAGSLFEKAAAQDSDGPWARKLSGATSAYLAPVELEDAGLQAVLVFPGNEYQRFERHNIGYLRALARMTGHAMSRSFRLEGAADAARSWATTGRLQQSAIEDLPFGVVLIDRHRRVLLWGGAMRRIAEMTAAQSAGRRFPDDFPQFDRDAALALIDRAFEAGPAPEPAVIQMPSASGGPWLAFARAANGAGGEKCVLFAIAESIDKLRKWLPTEPEKILEEQTRKQFGLETLMILDESGAPIYAAARPDNMTPEGEEPAISDRETLERWAGDDWREQWREFLEQRPREQRGSTIELDLRGRFGTFWAKALIAGPWEAANGGASAGRRILRIRNLEVEKLQEDSLHSRIKGLEQENAELQQTDELRRTALERKAETLRIPMAGILARLGAALQGQWGEAPPDLQDALRHCMDAALREIEAIDRLEKSAEPFAAAQFQTVDLAPAVREAALLAAPKAKEAGVAIRGNYDAFEGELPVFGDPEKLYGAFEILLSDAIARSEAGGEIKIGLEAEPDGEGAKVSVESASDSLEDPPRQTLAIVEDIVHAFGGRAVWSRNGERAEISLRLQGPAPEERAKIESPPLALIVSENPERLEWAARALKHWKIESIQAQTTADALIGLAEQRVDAILMELTDRSASTWELFDRLKKHPSYRDIPIIAAKAGALGKFVSLGILRPAEMRLAPNRSLARFPETIALSMEALAAVERAPEAACAALEGKALAAFDGGSELLPALKRLFEEFGSDLQSFGTSEELKAFLIERNPALLILDERENRFDARQIIRMVREEIGFSRLPILYLAQTAEHIEAALDAGADEFLLAPCFLNAILEKTLKLLGAINGRHENFE